MFLLKAVQLQRRWFHSLGILLHMTISQNLKAKIRHFYDLHYLWKDTESKAFLLSKEFKKEFYALLASDQARFKEPEGWREKSISDSPLISNFDNVWKELSETYSRELPELVYKAIPSLEDVSSSFKEVVKLLIYSPFDKAVGAPISRTVTL